MDLIVEDNGVGVPDDAKEKIFRREYFKNTGFGLFLTREILAITGLSISETRDTGHGCPFRYPRPERHVPDRSGVTTG